MGTGAARVKTDGMGVTWWGAESREQNRVCEREGGGGGCSRNTQPPTVATQPPTVSLESEEPAARSPSTDRL
eukprot:1123743-Rhodomonas_salina.4